MHFRGELSHCGESQIGGEEIRDVPYNFTGVASPPCFLFLSFFVGFLLVEKTIQKTNQLGRELGNLAQISET